MYIILLFLCIYLFNFYNAAIIINVYLHISLSFYVFSLLLLTRSFIPLCVYERIDTFQTLTIRTEIRKVLTKLKSAGILRLVFHDAGTFDLKEKKGCSFSS